MLELKALDNFKKIKLSTAQRYLRRYTGTIDCLDAIGIETVRRSCASGRLMPSFRPSVGDRVFLRGSGDAGDQIVAEMTEGLPVKAGYFVSETGEFREALSYEPVTSKEA